MTCNGYVVLIKNDELPDDLWLASQGILSWSTSGDLREAYVFTDKNFLESLMEEKSNNKRTLKVYKVSISLDKSKPTLVK